MTAFKTNYYDKYRVVYLKTQDLNISANKPPYVVRGVTIHQIITEAYVKVEIGFKNITAIAVFMSNFDQKSDVKLMEDGNECWLKSNGLVGNDDEYSISILSKNLEKLTGEHYIFKTYIYEQGKVHPVED